MNAGEGSVHSQARALEEGTFDLAVVGGGILGACVAWDAALRGLSVALLEQGDFGGGASANNLKILHGGLRYLQSAHLRRCRESIRERGFWLQVAPHLTDPLPVVFPAYRRGGPGRGALQAATLANEILSADRNHAVERSRHLPRGHGLSRLQVLERVPELNSPQLSGGIRFYDALMRSPERLVLEAVLAAGRAGAVTANHVAFERALWEDGRLAGVVARDVLDGGELRVRARTVVNAAGGHSDEVVDGLLPGPQGRTASRASPCVPGWSSAVNLVVEDLGYREAFALPLNEATGRQHLFVVPWRGRTMIGTGHEPLTETPPTSGRAALPEEWMERVRAHAGRRFAQRVRQVLPAVTDDRIRLVHWGLLPVSAGSTPASVALLPSPRILHHGSRGAPGVFTAVSVKFTTARRVAIRTVDRVCRWLGHPAAGGLSRGARLPGTPVGGLEALEAEAEARHGSLLDREVLRALLRHYGARYETVLFQRFGWDGWRRPVTAGSSVILAELRHGVVHEMARTPEDLVWRRTELGPRGDASASVMEAARGILERATGPGIGADEGSSRRPAPSPKYEASRGEP